MIRIENYQKSYGNQLVLEIPRLHIPSGIHWFKGSNGSGKSTLFKSLAGLIPFKGEISLNGLHIRREAVAYRMAVNYGEAEPLYPAFLSGRDLISFVSDGKKAPAGEREALIEQFSLGSYLDNPVGTYSSGMLKKVSLVMAFLGRPQLIILDEPLITIDKDASCLMLDLINSYSRQGTSFFLSSHQDFDPELLHVDTTYLLQNNTILHEAASCR